MNPHDNPFLDYSSLLGELELEHLSDQIDFHLCDFCDLTYQVTPGDGKCDKCSHCAVSCQHTADIWGWK